MRNLIRRTDKGIGSVKRKLVKNFVVWDIYWSRLFKKKKKLAVCLQKITEARKKILLKFYCEMRGKSRQSPLSK